MHCIVFYQLISSKISPDPSLHLPNTVVVRKRKLISLLWLGLPGLPAGSEAAGNIQQDPCTPKYQLVQGFLWVENWRQKRCTFHCCLGLNFSGIILDNSCLLLLRCPDCSTVPKMSTPTVCSVGQIMAALVLVPKESRSREGRKGQGMDLQSCLGCRQLQALLWAIKVMKSFSSVFFLCCLKSSTTCVTAFPLPVCY